MKQPGLQASAITGDIGGAVQAHLPGRVVARPWMTRVSLYRAIALALALGGLLLLRVPLESLDTPVVHRKDLVQEYLLGEAVLHGANPYAPISDLAARFLGPLPELVFQHPTPHPPVVGVLSLPLTLFTYQQAAAVWLIFELVCLVLSAYLILADLAPAESRPMAAFVLAGCALALPSFIQELTVGQFMIPLLLLLVLSWRALRRGQDLAAGLFLGITLALKFITWPVLLLFVWRKNWKALGAAIGVALLANLAALAVIGPSAMATYYLKVLPNVGSLYRAYETNVSLNSIGWRLFVGMGSAVQYGAIAPPLVASPLAAVVTSWLVPLGFLLVVLRALPQIRSWEAAFGILICVSVVVSPISWTHYQVLLGLPLCLAVFQLAARRFPRQLTLTGGLTLLLMCVASQDWHLLIWQFSSQQLPPIQPFTVPTAAGLISLIPMVPVLILIWVLWYLDRTHAWRRGGTI